MATVADILKFVETVAPRSMKMDWDNVGLNVGHRDKEVKRILVALDPFAHVCQEAKDIGADLLVTHHVLIFRPGLSPTPLPREKTPCSSLKTASPISTPIPTWT